jgi:hypothetical protein
MHNQDMGNNTANRGTTMSAKTRIVGEICMYGNSQTCGAGWLAAVEPTLDKRNRSVAQSTLLGDGDPKIGRAFTEALWQACDAIRETGPTAGLVRVYEPGGHWCATTSLSQPVCYGDLEWTPAPVLTISVEEIMAAAE